MGNFYTDVLQKNAVFLSPKRQPNLGLLEPFTQEAVKRVIADAQTLGITLIPWETFRSRARQEALFLQGATKLRNVGVHNYGLACDLVKFVDGEPSWKGDFTFLGTLAQHHGLIWGGDWGEPGIRHNFIDSVHVQRCLVNDQPRLFRGEWYPDANYLPPNGDA